VNLSKRELHTGSGYTRNPYPITPIVIRETNTFFSQYDTCNVNTSQKTALFPLLSVQSRDSPDSSQQVPNAVELDGNEEQDALSDD